MEVKTIAVIGAGTQGSNIAYASAIAGYRTILEDVSREILDRGLASIQQLFDAEVSRDKMESSIRDRALLLITTASSVEAAIRDADLVIETVPEEMEMKLELFTIFDKFGKPGAIFATTTSSLSISDMIDVTICQERCVGMQFFDEVSSANRIVITRTPLTSDETIATSREVAHRLGREVVLVRESSEVISTSRES
jgi:3-hydroxybutyryl-CoA dehydrogenase